MNRLMSLTAFSVVSSVAFGNTTPAAATSPTEPAAASPVAVEAPAAPAVKSDTSTKVGMRIQLDPFYKNLNDAAKNYKIPKLDSLRLKFERDFGKYSKADAELRLHELEKLKSSNGTPLANTDTLKYFHFLFKVPVVEGLELGYVRELEPALYGYTDRIISNTVVESPSFTGHMGRIEGYRALYKFDDKNKLTYHLARNPDQTDSTLGTKPSNTTWYHKLTSNNSVAGVDVEAGAGVQGKWLALSAGSKLKYDSFIHVVGKQKIEDLELKAGLAYDTYAVTQLDNGTVEAGTNTATTAIVAAKYALYPKEVTLIGELGYRTLKLASDGFTDRTVTDKKSMVDSAAEASLVLAGQYHLDEKLSFIPSYNFYNSNRAHLNANNKTGDALKDRDTLVSGAARKFAKSEHAFGLRIRYDY